MWQRGVTPQGRPNFGDSRKKLGYQQSGPDKDNGPSEGKVSEVSGSNVSSGINFRLLLGQRSSYANRTYKKREEKGRQKLQAVKVDGLAVLKIIKH